MNTHHKNKNKFVATIAAAAFAGLSFTSVSIGQQYIPPGNTPLDSTTLSSSSVILQNFNDFLNAIEDELAAGTLASSGPAPTANDFIAAVSAAIAAAPGDAYGIAQAAAAFNPNLTKKFVQAAVTATPAAAEDIVGGASLAAPKKAADAASSAILGLIASGGAGGTNNSEFDEAADAALLEQTFFAVEKIAKKATKAVKTALPTPGAQATAADIAKALVKTVLDNAGAMSNADLYLSAVASGAVSGVDGLTGVTKVAVAEAIMDEFGVHASSGNYHYAVRLAMGALKPANLTVGLEHALVAAALDAKLTAQNAAWAGAVDAGKDVMGRTKQGALGPVTEAEFKAFLTAAHAPDVYALVLGASVGAASQTASFTAWALTDPDALATLAYQQGVISAAVSGKPGGAGKVVFAATQNGVTGADAIGAAIGVARDLDAGKIVSNAYKGSPPADLAASEGYLSAAIAGAVAAGYQRALPEIALAAATADKVNRTALAEKAVEVVPNGWEEAAAAAIVAKYPSVKAAVDAEAGSKPGADAAGVAIATSVAAAGKASKKTLFDDALTAYIANPTKPRAVLVGAGAVNRKLAIPLLGAALRLKGIGSDSNAVLLNYAIALNKKKEASIRLGYETAVDVISDDGHRVFDVVDHKTRIHTKDIVAIVEGAVSARPEFAHYVARAAGRRGTKVAGKIGTAAIQFAHQKVVAGDNTSAVAAISAGLISGVLDANLADSTSAIRAAVGGLIKGVLSFVGTDGLTGTAFDEADGTVGGTVSKPSKGTAGVVTGAVAQTQGPGSAADTFSALSAAVVKTAVSKAKLHALAIGQAAAQAAHFVAQRESRPLPLPGGALALAIRNAVMDGGPSADPGDVLNAINTGLTQAAAFIVGAGAAGLTDTLVKYEHHSRMNRPVTDLLNF